MHVAEMQSDTTEDRARFHKDHLICQESLQIAFLQWKT